MSQHIGFRYIWHCWATKAQESRHKCADPLEPSLLAHSTWRGRWGLRPKFRPHDQWIRQHGHLILCPLVSSADNFFKQFRTRSGRTECRAWSGSKLFDTLMVFLKEFFEKVDFEKNQQTTKKHEKLPSRQRVNGGFLQEVPKYHLLAPLRLRTQTL